MATKHSKTDTDTIYRKSTVKKDKLEILTIDHIQELTCDKIQIKQSGKETITKKVISSDDANDFISTNLADTHPHSCLETLTAIEKRKIRFKRANIPEPKNKNYTIIL